MKLVYGPYFCSDGRRHADVSYNGRIKHVLWARYNLEKKLGRPLRKGETVDHIDDDKTNDRSSNLQVLTRSENARKSSSKEEVFGRLIRYSRSRKGRKRNSERQSGERNTQAQFSNAQVKAIRYKPPTTKTERARLCKELACSDRALRNMLTGVSYPNVGGPLLQLRVGRPKKEVCIWVTIRSST